MNYTIGPIEKISKKEKLYQNIIKIFSAEIFIYAFSDLEPRLIAHFVEIWKCLNLLTTFLHVVQILLLLLGWLIPFFPSDFPKDRDTNHEGQNDNDDDCGRVHLLLVYKVTVLGHSLKSLGALLFLRPSRSLHSQNSLLRLNLLFYLFLNSLSSLEIFYYLFFRVLGQLPLCIFYLLDQFLDLFILFRTQILVRDYWFNRLMELVLLFVWLFFCLVSFFFLAVLGRRLSFLFISSSAIRWWRREGSFLNLFFIFVLFACKRLIF